MNNDDFISGLLLGAKVDAIKKLKGQTPRAINDTDMNRASK